MSKLNMTLLIVVANFSVAFGAGRAEVIAEEKVRFATFNVAMNRDTAGKLVTDLREGHEQFHKLAEIIQRVRPDVLLLNEVDYDELNQAIEIFHTKYLSRGRNGQAPITYRHRFAAGVNTGIDSGLDLNRNGRNGDWADSFGFGKFPGQYGMAVLSRYPIQLENVRKFQKFLWKDMPNAELPKIPGLDNPYYDQKVMQTFRLSSKSHWDIPLRIDGKTIHFLVSHPTPPVFDGGEDRNGCRNHDEIRLWADYIDPKRGNYIYDDRQRKGGLPSGEHFVIAGDLNADPHDGDSRNEAVLQLTEHPLINNTVVPSSKGAVEQAKLQGKKNLQHKGNPAHDTSDFSDSGPGNMRIDYVLPSKTLEILEAGVFWPSTSDPSFELVDASDHRLVWIDVVIPQDP